MKALVLTIAVLFATGLILASPASAPTEKMGKTHDMTAEFVSADAKAKTITIKDDKGESKTVPAMGKALEKMTSFKAGDKVKLTCQDNDKGEHQGITDIAAAK